MTEMLEVGTYIALYVVENSGRYHVDPSYWDELDAAYHNWIERRIDRVVSLVCNDGSPLLIATSRMGEFYLSTPETRQRSRELTAADKAETGYVDET